MAIRFSKRHQTYGCFSNFYPCAVTVDGITYPTAENAFQAKKTDDVNTKIQMASMSPAEAKKFGRKLPLSPDWEDWKFNAMCDVLTAKFTQNADLQKILLETGQHFLIEDTTGWHDNEWGICTCPKCFGKRVCNKLGLALMLVRADLSGSRYVTVRPGKSSNSVTTTIDKLAADVIAGEHLTDWCWWDCWEG